jgi:glycosyltransferase involved in cell wall biosynthesis
MKIVFLTRLFLPSIGGVQKHVLELSKIATKNGHTVSVITERHLKKLKTIEHFKKIKIYRIPTGKKEKKSKKIKIWLWLIKNKKIIKEANIIHIHDVGFWIFPLKLIFPRKAFYVTFHGYEPNDYKKAKNKIEKKLAEFLTIRSIAVGSYLQKWYKIKPQKVIYGASFINPLHKRSKEYNFDACFIGRLEKDTGIENYIRAIEILKRKYNIKLNLIICGNGSLYKKIKKYIKSNKLSSKMVGWVNNPSYYISRSKFLLSSQYLTIIEGAQLKKMIFSIYDTDIKKDYLKSLPIAKEISISSNLSQLAESIRNFTKNPNNYKKRISSAYLWASKQTWAKLYNDYLSLWGIT